MTAILVLLDVLLVVMNFLIAARYHDAGNTRYYRLYLGLGFMWVAGTVLNITAWAAS